MTASSQLEQARAAEQQATEDRKRLEREVEENRRKEKYDSEKAKYLTHREQVMIEMNQHLSNLGIKAEWTERGDSSFPSLYFWPIASSICISIEQRVNAGDWHTTRSPEAVVKVEAQYSKWKTITYKRADKSNKVNCEKAALKVLEWVDDYKRIIEHEACAAALAKDLEQSLEAALTGLNIHPSLRVTMSSDNTMTVRISQSGLSLDQVKRLNSILSENSIRRESN